jgi:protocadherin Fat 4
MMLTIILIFPVFCAHAWSFLTGTLNAPYSQCLTCHVSNSNYALNPYGQDYLDPTFAATYHSRHNSPPGDCNNCHAGKGYPIKQSGLDNMDSDGDTYTNLAEFNAGTFPGDASDYPVDTAPPVITAFSLPATSNSLTVAISSLTVTDNVAVTGYLLTESSAAPSVGDAGWRTTAPTHYSFAAAGVSTLYAWAKDAAGNVSAPSSAQVDTTPSLNRVNNPPVAFAGIDQVVTEGQTVTLDAGESTDDLGIVTYNWVQLDGPGGSALAAGQMDQVVLSDPTSITPSFITPAVGVNGTMLTFELTVTDGDGAQNSDEVYITVADNGISTFDHMQGVVSTMTADGASIAFNAGTGNACTNLHTLTLQDMPAALLQPRDLLYGVLDFDLKVTDGANSYITFHFPEPVPAGYKWYKYTAAKGWFDFDRDLVSGGTGEGAVFSPDRTQVTIYIDDNSAYDDNPTSGIIRDPGALAAGITASTATAGSAPGSNSFGSNSSGCFLDAVIAHDDLNGPASIFLVGLFILWIIENVFAHWQNRK